MKQIATCIFALIFFASPALGQNLPSWAEPSEDRSFGTTQAERQAPDRSQRERSSGLSRSPGPVTWNQGQGKGNGNNGEIADSPGTCKKLDHRTPNCNEICNDKLDENENHGACNQYFDRAKPIPIDNPFALGFLIAAAFAYAYIKL